MSTLRTSRLPYRLCHPPLRIGHPLLGTSSRVILLIACLSCLLSCMEDRSRLFTKLPQSRTGINFRNLQQETLPEFNIMQYPYFYNGGGVAVGGINNDGLPDICFTGNMVKNRLFLNKGNFQF